MRLERSVYKKIMFSAAFIAVSHLFILVVFLNQYTTKIWCIFCAIYVILFIFSYLESKKEINSSINVIRQRAVKQNGYALRLIKEQTEDLCLTAVKRNGYALQYVKKQTEAICLAAIKQEGHALKHVKKQTEDICLIAIKQNAYALQHVKEQTEIICLTAIKQNKEVLEYVNKEMFVVL